MVVAIPELIWFALLLISFAVVYMLRKFIEALFSPLIAVFRPIPGVGSAIDGALTKIEQSVSSALGAVEHGIDAAIGASFHAMANLIGRFWDEFKSHANLIALTAAGVADLYDAYKWIRRHVHDISKGINDEVKHLAKLEKTLARGIDRLTSRVKKLERGIGRDVISRVNALDRELGHVTHDVIPSIRSAANTAEAEVSALEKWIAQNVPLLGTTALVGAVAWALSRLGLGGLRCNNLTNALGRRGCGLWSGLEDLLGLFIDALLLSNICALLPTFEGLVSDVAEPLVVGLTDVGAGLCSGGIGPAPLLAVPALSLPANPGVTLNLP